MECFFTKAQALLSSVVRYVANRNDLMVLERIELIELATAVVVEVSLIEDARNEFVRRRSHITH